MKRHLYSLVWQCAPMNQGTNLPYTKRSCCLKSFNVLSGFAFHVTWLRIIFFFYFCMWQLTFGFEFSETWGFMTKPQKLVTKKSQRVTLAVAINRLFACIMQKETQLYCNRWPFSLSLKNNKICWYYTAISSLGQSSYIRLT